MFAKLIVAASLFVSSAAFASPDAPIADTKPATSTESEKPVAAKPMTFEQLDADADKSISVTEAEKSEALKASFKVADVDESGDLSATEFKAWNDAKAKKAADAK